MVPDRLGVIGLGAIGGSVAWGAARSGVSRILGYSPDRRDAVGAARHGAVTEVATDARRVVLGADFLVLAAPPGATLELLREHAALIRQRGLLSTDVASVKGPVIALAAQLGLGATFAGSHPLAGTHDRGFRGARPDRFEQAVVYVSPVDEASTAINEVSDFWSRVFGALPVQIQAGRHDEMVAWTSHLPQVVSSALAVALARHAPEGARLGRGALDTTRIAAGSVEMWADILLMNREVLMASLEGFHPVINELREALTRGDSHAITGLLEEGARWRRGVS